MIARTPKPRRPILVHCEDLIQERQDAMALERVGRPESLHDMNATVRVDMSHAVIACGRCGGVYGGDGVKLDEAGNIIGRCPTKRCTCRGRRAARASRPVST